MGPVSKLVIHQKYCQLEDEEDLNFLQILDAELSYLIPGAQYSNYFKSGRWDGRKRLLDNKLRCSYGLKSRVLDFYKSQNKQIEVVDQRPAKSAAQSVDIIPRLKELGITPYDYQLNVLQTIEDKKLDIGVIRVGTGGGKSLIAALMTAKLGRPTVIWVVGNDLLHQFHKFFNKVFKQKIGIIGDGLFDVENANISIVSVWTAGRAFGLKKNIFEDSEEESEIEFDSDKYQQIASYLKEIKVHIFDECQLCAAESLRNILNNINYEYLFGMSASPFRQGNEVIIEAALGKVIINLSASFLIENGFLTQPIIKFVKVPKYPIPLTKNYHSVYANYITENDVRNQLIVDSTVKIVELGYTTLVVFNTIRHGNILYQALKDKIPCALLSGKDNSEKREKVKQQLIDGKIKAIIASRIFDVGLDIPIISGMVLAAPSKSYIRCIQRIGRILRKHPDKKRCVVVDFADSAHYVKDHAKIRRSIYEMEPGFIIQK
jgi:superfamily II DNA or RNA helicase